MIDDPRAHGFRRRGPGRATGRRRTGWARPERLEPAARVAPGRRAVARPKAARARPRRRSAICCFRRPRRYETAADEVADLAALGRRGGRRSPASCRRPAAPARRPPLARHRAASRDATGSISAQLVQPAVAARPAQARDARAAARPLGRDGFDVKSYDVGEARATADFAPVYGASEQVPSTRLRELVRARARRSTRTTSSTRCRPSSSCRCGATRSPRCTSRRPGGGRAGAAAARARRAARAAARRAALARTTTRSRRRSASRASSSPLPRRAPVRAHRAPGAGDRRDRPRPRARRADAAAAAGRRRLGQDGRRALRAAARGRGGASGRADGADGDPRRAALPHRRGALRRSSACARVC